MPWKPSQPATTSQRSSCVGALVAEADARAARSRGRAATTSSTSKRSVAAGVQARGDEVLDHLLLAVDRDRPPAGELGEVDAVPAPVEAQLEAVVDEALAVQALGDAGLVEQVDRRPARARPARTRASTYSRAARLEDDRLDALRGASRWASSSPAGPAPTIPTWVSITRRRRPRRARAGRRRRRCWPPAPRRRSRRAAGPRRSRPPSARCAARRGRAWRSPPRRAAS